MRAYLIVAATLAIACVDAVGQVYRWVDEQGGVHYSQTPPPASAKDIQKKNLRQSGTAATEDLPYATQLAAKNFPVKLYTQPECGPCDAARASLVKRGVPFSEVSVLTQKDLDEVRKISGGPSLPLLVVGALFQSGFQEALVNGLLDTAGYPPAGPRLPVEALRKPAPPASPAPPRPSPMGAEPDADSK